MAYVSFAGALGRRPVRKYRATQRRHPSNDPTKFICTTCAARKASKVVIGRTAYAGIEYVENGVHLWIAVTVNERVELLADERVANDYMTCAAAVAKLQARAEQSGYTVLASRGWEFFQEKS